MSRLREAVKTLVLPVYWRWIRCCVRWPKLSSVHYAFSSTFQREHHGVLAGRLAHYESQQASPSDNSAQEFRLRRLIHRIEKGLVMIPRRETFAVDFIGEVLDLYEECLANQTHSLPNPQATCQIDATLKQWAESVLEAYFEVAGGHHVIDAARERFRAIEPTNADSPTQATCAPYPVSESACPIDYSSLLETAMRRRSVRWYEDQRVPRELIDQAIQVASLSPSACNRQPFRFHVFDDPDDARSAALLPGGSSGFSHNIPCLIVATGDLRAYAKEYDRHLIYIDSGLALMGLIYALETLGLASCCLNWADIPAKEKAMAELLELPPYERTIMCLAVGYSKPGSQVPFSQKKGLSQLRKYKPSP